MLRLATPRGDIAIGVAVSDLDRTLTDARLRPVPSALGAFGALRHHDVRTVLATGRTLGQLRQPDRLRDAFDALVLEGGAVVEQGGKATVVSRRTHELAALGRWLEAQGIPFRPGASSLSVEGRAGRSLARYPRRRAVAAHRNRDRIDVTVAGIDKQVGLRVALRRWRVAPGRGTLAFGDAENDLCLFRTAEYSVAVRNAVPSVRAAADAVTRRPGGRGVAEFLAERVLGGDGSS